MEVARFADKCLWENDWIPHIALSDTHGEIQASNPHDIIGDGAKCDAFLAINSEGAIDRKERLKFWIEVSILLFDFYRPTVALLQDGQPCLHQLNNPEVPHVKFERRNHTPICDQIIRVLKTTIENWARRPAYEIPLGQEIPERSAQNGT